MISTAIALVKEIVEGLGQKVPIWSWRAVNNVTMRIYIHNTLWLRAGGVVNIETEEAGDPASVKEYEVTAVAPCSYIEVTMDDTVVITGDTLALAPLGFKSGTVIAVDAEMQLGNNVPSLMPLVYMVEVMSSEQVHEPLSNIGERAEVRLLILNECDVANWTTEDHYTNVIEVTEQIAKTLLEAFKMSGKIGLLTTSRTWNHVQVGTFNDNGHTKRTFSVDFSGVEMRLTLPIILNNCNCN